jgi:hypothetical protein
MSKTFAVCTNGKAASIGGGGASIDGASGTAVGESPQAAAATMIAHRGAR